MEIPPQQGPLIEEEERASYAAKRRQQDLLTMVTACDSADPGEGERLLPYLVAAMETCWVDAILIALASLNPWLRGTPLLPLWAPFVLIACAFWLITRLERREVVREQPSEGRQKTKRVSGSSLFIVLITLLVVLIVWASIYSSHWFFVDPRWLSALLNDFFLLAPNAYYVLVLAGLAIYFCWRGIRLARRTIEPSSIFWVLRWGIGIIIVAILVASASGLGFLDKLILLGLIPFFLFCSLAAHALAKAGFIRRYHPAGFQGSVAAQERALLMILVVVGLFMLLLAFGTGIFVSSAFLADVQHALEPIGRVYDWLVSIIAYGITFLLYPIIWLLSRLHFQPVTVLTHQYQGRFNGNGIRSQSTDPIVLFVVPILKIVLPILFIVLMIWLIRWSLRRRHIVLLRREQHDVHESLWSWRLFLSQAMVFLLAIWRRFFPQRPSEQGKLEESGGEPTKQTVRTIREIYRAFLRWAAGYGYNRKQDETPDEFRLRLHGQWPQADLELSSLTDAYSAVRYGDIEFGEAEVTRVQTDWATLQSDVIDKEEYSKMGRMPDG